MLVSSSSYQQLSSDTGVYLFLDKKSNVIYVGKAINLKSRVSSYFLNTDLGQKTKKLVSQIDKIKTINVTSEVESFLLEERLIKKYSPKYNIDFKDDKTYPYLKITIKEKYPSIQIVRKVTDKNSLYFGPYTSVSSLKVVLKLLRRIFPYQSVTNHGDKLCLYYHLGLCPCPQVTDNKYYSKTLKYIIDFLNGNTKKVLKNLKKERDDKSINENFEGAMDLQKKIDSINLITSSFYKPFYFEENPNLSKDLINFELNSLIQILNLNNVNVENLERIECYDVSNTQGTNATASMVVLTNGVKDSSSYRRFKISKNYKDKPNDFAMMHEVLLRRLKHNEWKTPSLIVVDGGKGQITSAKKALIELNLQIPLIGLAKKEEIIITSDFKEIKLPKSSKALQVIIRIRDEAHRFAIAYHKKLRSKSIFD